MLTDEKETLSSIVRIMGSRRFVRISEGELSGGVNTESCCD